MKSGDKRNGLARAWHGPRNRMQHVEGSLNWKRLTAVPSIGGRALELRSYFLHVFHGKLDSAGEVHNMSPQMPEPAMGLTIDSSIMLKNAAPEGIWKLHARSRLHRPSYGASMS